jgi:hypothetical protein
VRRDGGGRLGGEGELGAHRGHRNGVVMPADVRSSDEKFEQPGGSGPEGRRMGKESVAYLCFICASPGSITSTHSTR